MSLNRYNPKRDTNEQAQNQGHDGFGDQEIPF